MEATDFYEEGCFLRRKLISTEEAYFYGDADLYGESPFLRRRLISTERAHFFRGGQFPCKRLTLAWKIRTISQRKQVFIQEGVCFTVCSSDTCGPP